MLGQTVFDTWGESIKEAIENTDPIMAWGWTLLIASIVFVFALIYFTEFKRKERESVKFSAITLVIASLLFGFGLHLILTADGLW